MLSGNAQRVGSPKKNTKLGGCIIGTRVPKYSTRVNFDTCHHPRRLLVRRRPSRPADTLMWLGDD